MKSLVEYITEAISKSEILKSVKEVNDIEPILVDLGFKKNRSHKWAMAVKKVLGTKKSLYVASTYGTDKSNIEALKAIIDKGQVVRNGSTRSSKGDYFVLSPVDMATANVKNRGLLGGKSMDDIKGSDLEERIKNNMRDDLARNAYIKKVGITDEVKNQIDELCKKFAKEFEIDSLCMFLRSKEGDQTYLIPSLFVVGKNVVKAVVFGCDLLDGEDMYNKKLEGNFLIVFSKEDIDELKEDEAK